jgi:hypothetical protein
MPDSDYTLNLADPPVLGSGVVLQRDWHVQLDFAPKAGQPERLWVRVEPGTENAALADWSKAGMPLGYCCRATCWRSRTGTSSTSR